MADSVIPLHRPQGRPFRTRRSNRWTLGVLFLALCHLAFFLPVRSWVPFPGYVDPWWAIDIVLADAAGVVILIGIIVRKLIQTKHPEPVD